MSGQLTIIGLKKEYEGKRDQALADLRVYLTAPVGVGEHSSLSTEVKAIIDRISQCDSVLSTIGTYIQEAPQENTSEENTPASE